MATQAISFVYGPSYHDAGPVLSIHILSSIFVFLGVASSQYLIAEGLQIVSMQRTIFGLVLNILLNIIMIPRHGVVGASVATLISQAGAAFLFDLLQKRTRPMFAMKIKSLNILRFIKFLTKSHLAST